MPAELHLVTEEPRNGGVTRRYVAVVHVELTASWLNHPDDPDAGPRYAADLLTAGVTDPGEEVQLISITEVAK